PAPDVTTPEVPEAVEPAGGLESIGVPAPAADATEPDAPEPDAPEPAEAPLVPVALLVPPPVAGEVDPADGPLAAGDVRKTPATTAGAPPAAVVVDDDVAVVLPGAAVVPARPVVAPPPGIAA